MILFAQGTKARVVTCSDQSCMHLRCWQVKLCLTIYVKVHKYKTQVVILEWFAYFYYFGEISQIPLIISNNIFRTSNGKKYNSSNIFHSFQFLLEEIGRNSYLPVSSGCPRRNTFLPEEKQPWIDIWSRKTNLKYFIAEEDLKSHAKLYGHHCICWWLRSLGARASADTVVSNCTVFHTVLSWTPSICD